MRTELLELLEYAEKHQKTWGPRLPSKAEDELWSAAARIRAKLDLQEKGEREAADELVEHELPTAAEIFSGERSFGGSE